MPELNNTSKTNCTVHWYPDSMRHVVLFDFFFQWVPPPQDNTKEKEADEQIAIDLGDEYEQALSAATQEEIIDLAGKKLDCLAKARRIKIEG